MPNISVAKRRFLLCASLLNGFPFLALIPFAGGAIYSMPVFAIIQITGGSSSTLLNGSFGVLPNLRGFLVSMPFWLVVGMINGVLLFKFRESRYLKSGKLEYLRFGTGAVVTTLSLQIGMGLLLGLFLHFVK
jgi:hypothetical protein